MADCLRVHELIDELEAIILEVLEVTCNKLFSLADDLVPSGDQLVTMLSTRHLSSLTCNKPLSLTDDLVPSRDQLVNQMTGLHQRVDIN